MPSFQNPRIQKSRLHPLAAAYPSLAAYLCRLRPDPIAARLPSPLPPGSRRRLRPDPVAASARIPSPPGSRLRLRPAPVSASARIPSPPPPGSRRRLRLRPAPVSVYARLPWPSTPGNPARSVPVASTRHGRPLLLPVLCVGSLVNSKEVLYYVHKRQFMNGSLAMYGVYGEKPPMEVSADPSRSRNSIDEDDDWVVVKKQRINILIPPPSPDAANRESDMPTISSKHSSLTGSKRDWDAARKKQPKQLIAKKSKDFPPEDDNSEKAQVDRSESTVQKDVPRMAGDIPPHSPAAPVVKSEWTEGGHQAVKGLFHQGGGKVTSSSGIMDDSRMLIISSPVANKIMRARLLERRVAGLGGLRNWLFDSSLGWFVEILDSEKLGMYQLVSLTMNQLKEMGLVAVGPRRKLIHAIDSLCRPCEMVS